MKLCYLLPKVKSTLKVPTDKHLLQQLEMSVRKLLCEEKDKDVLNIVKKVCEVLLFIQYFSYIFIIILKITDFIVQNYSLLNVTIKPK